ncbi:MAG: hypothetical protein HYX92_05515 [Chloroflexi bacterium]|nr:hypothetical protein [Chloroflexota bacterium]
MAKVRQALDPTAELKKRAQRAPNPIPSDLNGKTIGFLNDDGGGQRLRIDSLLKAVEKGLRDQYRLGEVIYKEKFRHKAGQGASEETLNELAARSDLVINGVGL